MQNKFKKAVAIICAFLVLIVLGFYSFNLQNPRVSENLARNNYLDNTQNLNSENTENLNNSTNNVNSLENIVRIKEGEFFEAKTLSAGGSNWVLSIKESQPSVFTGKLLAHNGLDIFDLFLQSKENLYAGEAKNIKTKKISSILINTETKDCTDTEKNKYEKTINIILAEEKISGCGGKIISIK